MSRVYGKDQTCQSVNDLNVKLLWGGTKTGITPKGKARSCPVAAAGGWGIPRMSSLCWQGCSDSKKLELFPNAATPVDAVCVSAGQHWIGVVLGLGNWLGDILE